MVSFSLLRGRAPRAPLALPYDAGSHEGLAARWVRWAAGSGVAHHPLLDTTGEDAHLGQPDDVWFLGGTFGGAASRRCDVPPGVPLFFPAFNMWWTDTAEIPADLPEGSGHASVDGVAVPLETILTPVGFDVAGARSNPVTRTRSPVSMTVWGLWATVPPLSTGSHAVRLGGSDGHGFTVAADYHLEIGP